MVVLLEELEVQALIDVPFENCEQFLELCLVFELCGRGCALRDDRLDEGLAFFLDDIEGDLVCDQVVLTRQQLHEELGGEVWAIQMELALRNFVVVVVLIATRWPTLVHLEDHVEDHAAEDHAAASGAYASSIGASAGCCFVVIWKWLGCQPRLG